MIITLNTLKNIFKIYVDNNKIINDFYFGDIQSITNENNSYKYPLLAFSPSGVVLSKNTGNQISSIQYQFDIVCADLVNGDKSNVDDIISDSIQNLSDFISFIDQSQYMNQYNISIGGTNVNFNIFYDDYSDVIAGCSAQLSIEVEFRTSNCEIPMDEFLYKNLDC